MVANPLARIALCFSLVSSGIASTVSAETVLLDFYSPSCGPCRQMRPVVRRLEAEGVTIRKVDASQDTQLAQKFRVTGLPTFIVLRNGRETSRVEGFTGYEQIQQMLEHAYSLEQQQASNGQPANTAAGTVMQVGANNSFDYSQTQDLSQPQEGRIVEIQDPNAEAKRPRARRDPRPQAMNAVANNNMAAGHKSLIEASVQLAVTDPDGRSKGTGTIVDARQGEALILTCGHIFRTSKGEGDIEITTYQVGAANALSKQTYAGQLIDYDLERDLALVSFSPKRAVRPTPIARPGTPLQPGAKVTTVGCNHGQDPTALDSQISANDRYQGPPNVEVTGAPVEGRSGGGLFNAEGQLIGVCFAADPQGNEGLYSSLPSIHAKLDSLGLGMVYQEPAAAAGMNTISQAAPSQPETPPSNVAIRGQEPSIEDFAAVPSRTSEPQPTPQAEAEPLSAVESATLEEIRSRAANAEVICIIRPQSPDAKSEVITLNNASPGFVQALSQPANSATGSAEQQAFHPEDAGQLLR